MGDRRLPGARELWMVKPRIVRSRVRMGRLVDPDGAKPTDIEHKCDEIFDGDTLQQKYNYFVHHFERDDRYFWQRRIRYRLVSTAIAPIDRAISIDS